MRKIIYLFCFGSCLSALADPPERIENFQAVATNGSIVVSWTNPTNIVTLTELDVRFDTSAISTRNFASKPRVLELSDPGAPSSTQALVIPGLVSGTTYYVAIKVKDDSGNWSIMSDVVYVTAGGSTYWIQVGWTQSPSVDVTGYRIYEGVESELYTNSVSVENVTIATINNLQYGTTYYFAATSLDGLGNESVFSNEASFHLP